MSAADKWFVYEIHTPNGHVHKSEWGVLNFTTALSEAFYDAQLKGLAIARITIKRRKLE